MAQGNEQHEQQGDIQRDDRQNAFFNVAPQPVMHKFCGEININRT